MTDPAGGAPTPAPPAWVGCVDPRADGPITRTHHRVGLLTEPVRAALGAAARPVPWRELCRRLGEATASALLADGWLFDLPAWATRPRTTPRPTGAVLLVASRGRPELLSRLLEHLVHQPARLPLAVCLDGSPTQVRASLRVLGASPLDVRVSTPASRAMAASRVAACVGLPDAALAFGLAAGWPGANDPVRTGGARNALLLFAGARAAAFIDDDIQPIGQVQAWRPRWAHPADVFRNEPVSLAEATARATQGIDLREVTAPLGLSPAKLLDLGPKAPLWTSASAATLRCVTARRAPRIRLTSAGLLGDEGTSGTLHRLFLSSPLDELLRDDPSAWPQLRSSRSAARTAGHGALGPSHPWMTALAGVDPSGGWAPFLPAGRGSDATFASTLHHLHDDTVCASLPMMALHLPPPRQVPDAGPVGDVLSIHLNELVQRALRRLTAHAHHTPADRLHQLGHATLATLGPNPTSLQRAWHDLQRHRDASLLVSLHALAERGPASPGWRRDVRSATDLLEAALDAAQPRPPVDLRRSEHPWPSAYNTLHTWATLCLAWPEVQRHANGLDDAFQSPSAALKALG